MVWEQCSQKRQFSCVNKKSLWNDWICIVLQFKVHDILRRLLNFCHFFFKLLISVRLFTKFIRPFVIGPRWAKFLWLSQNIWTLTTKNVCRHNFSKMTVTYAEIITYLLFLLNCYVHLLMLAVASYIAQKKIGFWNLDNFYELIWWGKLKSLARLLIASYT